MHFQYYPGGMLMPGRRYPANNSYRFGFNGKENDNEVKGTGNEENYGMRIYDTRLLKFLSVDPLFNTYPWYTPYQFAANNPIWAIDLDGEEDLITVRKIYDEGKFDVTTEFNPGPGTMLKLSTRSEYYASGSSSSNHGNNPHLIEFRNQGSVPLEIAKAPMADPTLNIPSKPHELALIRTPTTKPIVEESKSKDLLSGGARPGKHNPDFHGIDLKTGVSLTLNVSFDGKTADIIDKSSLTEIENLAKQLIANKSINITLQGNFLGGTNILEHGAIKDKMVPEVEPKISFEDLAKNRSQAVKDVLTKNFHIDSSRINVENGQANEQSTVLKIE